MRQAIKKKLVVVTWFFPGQPGFLDFSYRIRTLAEHYDLTVLSREPIVQEELLTERAKYKTLSTAGTSKRDMLKYQYAAWREIRDIRPAGTVLLGSQLATMALLIRNIPTFIYWNEHPSHFANPDQKSLIKRWANRLFYELAYKGAKAADLVLPIGEAHRDDLLNMGVPPEKIEMMYMGVHSMFQAIDRNGQSRPDRKIRLIYTGSVEEARGRDVMLEGLALANAGSSIATLTIVGASEDQVQYCNSKATELGVANDVKVVGRVPGYEIPKYLQDADFGVCIWEDRPCWRFNPPTKLFEYLVAGLPILASNIRTHTCYVEHQDNGLIFDYGPEEFSKAILAASCQDIELLRANAKSTGARYLWPQIEPQLVSAIEGVFVQSERCCRMG